ncbi:MAG: hypothetical protein LBT00_15520 [Spirochaetaceae bacterium]|nr:hypothetical protein [Spirochaetaceae bacterium]
MLGDGVIPVACRSLNSTRPKEACLAVVLLRWVPLAQHYPFRGVLCGVALPIGNRFLNGTRLQEACYAARLSPSATDF